MMRAVLLEGALIAACSSPSGPTGPKPGHEVPRAVHVECIDGPGMGNRGMGPGAGGMGRGEMRQGDHAGVDG